MLVSVDHAGHASVDFRPLDVVRWEAITIEAGGCDGAYDVIDRFRGSLPALLSATPVGLTVVRVRVAGTTPAHHELMSDPERWETEIRSIASEEGPGRLWVEKVRLSTQPLRSGDDLLPEGAVGELVSLIDEIGSEPAALRDLASELSDLEKKLPREFREGTESWDPARPEWLAGLLSESKSMLLRRLMKARDAA